jgi:hypothetical protein
MYIYVVFFWKRFSKVHAILRTLFVVKYNLFTAQYYSFNSKLLIGQGVVIMF